MRLAAVPLRHHAEFRELLATGDSWSGRVHGHPLRTAPRNCYRCCAGTGRAARHTSMAPPTAWRDPKHTIFILRPAARSRHRLRRAASTRRRDRPRLAVSLSEIKRIRPPVCSCDSPPPRQRPLAAHSGIDIGGADGGASGGGVADSAAALSESAEPLVGRINFRKDWRWNSRQIDSKFRFGSCGSAAEQCLRVPAAPGQPPKPHRPHAGVRDERVTWVTARPRPVIPASGS